jgi:oxygen-independent coproporphyrinogen-3 oxidase
MIPKGQGMERVDYMRFEELSIKYNESNMPLYLTYPVQSNWRGVYREALSPAAPGRHAPPFLYFHFPFCPKACYYCMCYKHITTDVARLEEYARYLKKEIVLKLDRTGVAGTEIRQMHWGGGTPTYMPERLIEDVILCIAGAVSLSKDTGAGYSIEAYPDEEQVTESKLLCLKRLGFNEISFGVQDFDERVQRAINRTCSVHSTRKIIEAARAAGLRVHVDLCYGLPFQGLGEFERTLKTVAAMHPDRIACFTYAHYPLEFPLQANIPRSALPNPFIRLLLAKLAGDVLSGSGYLKIGYDHYAVPGDPLHTAYKNKSAVRDLMGYSVEGRNEYVGFGASAISFMGGCYMQNSTALQSYFNALDHDDMPLEKNVFHEQSDDDRIRFDIIQKQLMTYFAIDVREINARYGIDFRSCFSGELERLGRYRSDGLIEDAGDCIRVTDDGRYFLRHIAHIFDTYYAH